MAATEGRARSYVFSPLASRLQLARERRRELRVDEKAQSSAPQDGVVVLPGGELQHCGDILRFEVWIIRENLLARSTGSKQVEHILHADAQATNARTAPADLWAHRDAVERAHTRIVARLETLKFAGSERPPRPFRSESTFQRGWPALCREGAVVAAGKLGEGATAIDAAEERATALQHAHGSRGRSASQGDDGRKS